MFVLSLAFVSLISSFRSIADPSGATSHSFIGRKETQEGIENFVGGLLRRAKGIVKKY